MRLSLLIGAILLAANSAAAQQSNAERPIPMDPKTGQQIRDILARKSGLENAQKKMSSGLLAIIPSDDLKLPDQKLQLEKRLNLETKKEEAKTIVVQIRGEITSGLIDRIKEAGGQIMESYPEQHTLTANIPTSALVSISSMPDVRNVDLPSRPILKKMQFTPQSGGTVLAKDLVESLIAIGVDEARKTYKQYNGTGVTVCILSNGIQHIQEVQQAGHLPTITWLKDQNAPLPEYKNRDGAEGTAMLVIVHAIAPGARLMFATAMNSAEGFAHNIRGLKDAGCNILVDDVDYDDEPVFQDGIIAQAVADVVRAGAHYYAAAGNYGNKISNASGTWDGEFRAAQLPAAWAESLEVQPGFAGAQVHDFGKGQVINPLKGEWGCSSKGSDMISLQWADPWRRANNDYDLFLVDMTSNDVLDSSTDIQTITLVPRETLTGCNNYCRLHKCGLVITKSVDAKEKYLHLSTFGGRLEISTEGEISGHTAASEAFSVAALRLDQAAGKLFQAGGAYSVEFFSSDGPRRIYYDKNGASLNSAPGFVIRNKVDLTSADGANTQVPGYTAFFGTSAAAAHAAGIGALALSLRPTLTPDELIVLLNQTALDIAIGGNRSASGAGIVLANTLLAAIHKINETFPPATWLPNNR